jgi:hypothetical protein
MLDVLTDSEIKPGRIFIYGGFDASASKHLLSDEHPKDPWAERFPVGRTGIMVLPPSKTGRVRFEMINLDNDDSDVWAGWANAARCLVDENAYVPRERPVRELSEAERERNAAEARRQNNPRTLYLKFVTAMARTQRQKNRAADLLRFEKSFYAKHAGGFYPHGQIERFSGLHPISATFIKAEIVSCYRRRRADLGAAK